MEYRYLGRSGLQVSAIGLGGNTFGTIFRTHLDAEDTRRVIERALDLGVNFIDTADVYSRGLSEEYVGRAIAGRRREVVLASKFASPMGEGPNRRGASRGYLMSAVEDSLRRLGTDYIDLYQVHRPDPNTPIEETLRALDDLVRQGKVRYLGTSNFAAWQITEAALVARYEHLTPFISEQPLYNLMARGIEAEVVPACLKYGVGVIPYSPLSGGFLSGKYRRGAPPPEGARLSAGPMSQRILTDRNFDYLESLEAFAAARGRTVQELAIAWLLRRPAVSTVIVGATGPDQVSQNVKAGEWSLSDAEMQELESLRPK